jgi:hypothetical protein
MEKIPEYVVRVNAGQKIQPKTISIRGGDDAFDRYKMRQLFVQIVGKGKMIRTVLLNVDEVADNLKTEPSCIFCSPVCRLVVFVECATIWFRISVHVLSKK